MRLTQYTDFAIRVLIHLGVHPDRRCTIQEIADSYQISRNHLMKVVQQLAQAGFVDSARGAHGGLMLGRPPAQINLGEVIESMEPDFGLVECFRENNQCVITPACRLPRMLDRARRAFLSVLHEYTLADLVGPGDAEALLRLLHR
ncbi:MAG: nitric oxide-sensing transcriptional repressor NsrR [Wenzhouxiangellaceae bacterium]